MNPRSFFARIGVCRFSQRPSRTRERIPAPWSRMTSFTDPTADPLPPPLPRTDGSARGRHRCFESGARSHRRPPAEEFPLRRQRLRSDHLHVHRLHAPHDRLPRLLDPRPPRQLRRPDDRAQGGVNCSALGYGCRSLTDPRSAQSAIVAPGVSGWKARPHLRFRYGLTSKFNPLFLLGKPGLACGCVTA